MNEMCFGHMADFKKIKHKLKTLLAKNVHSASQHHSLSDDLFYGPCLTFEP